MFIKVAVILKKTIRGKKLRDTRSTTMGGCKD